MSATVKIERKKKEKLDRFVASLLLREGIKITLQEALSLMIDYALENEEEIVRRLKEAHPLRKTQRGRPSKAQLAGGEGFFKAYR
ncbi:TPA: hypothetical protein EYP26_03295 [Candidatus Bathyarchaeota archaeon]|nr:hypothetical protein [Candidatus Bathyarchaeota archaeon]